jgi:hypothetical protein
MATRDLGSFGQEREAHDASFVFVGERFRVHPDLTDLTLFRFMERAENIDMGDDVEPTPQQEREAMDLVLGQLTGLVHPDDWQRFLDHSIAKRQQYIDLMVLMKGLVEALGKDRTSRRSDSPGGRKKGRGKLKRSSSGRVIRRLEDQGRPDLAAVVAMARDAPQTA